jgi:hypothetical protein
MDRERKHSRELQTTYAYDDVDDKITFAYRQDVSGLLAENRALQNHNDGYTQDRTMKRVARIPLVVCEKIRIEKGWDPMHPHNSEKLLQLLDEPEYAYLKTSEGKVSKRPARQFFHGKATVKPVYHGDE